MKELFTPPAIVKPARNLAELAVEIKTAHYSSETGLKTGLDKGRKAGELLLEAKEQVGHGNWEKWIADNLPFKARRARQYMTLFKTAITAVLDELITVEEDTESEPDSVRVLSEGNGQSTTTPIFENQDRSPLWDSAPASALAKLPGGEKLSPVAKLPTLVLGHLKNFASALSDFSRCYDLPANADRLGERLKAVRDWATEHVPKAKLKPRKPPYKKQCVKCLHQIEMTMKENYSWAPLDLPNDEYGHWEVIEGIAYFRKTAEARFRTDHRRTCPKAEQNKPIPE